MAEGHARDVSLGNYAQDVDTEADAQSHHLRSPLLGHQNLHADSSTATFVPKRQADESFILTHEEHDDHGDPHNLKHLLPPPPESLDFDNWESRVNLVYNIELLKRGHLNSILKWLFVFAIGASTALVAVFIDFFVKKLTAGKLDMLYSNLEKEREGTQSGTVGFWVYALTNAAMVFVASCTVVLGEPMAAGSGIPEIKTLLNGIKVPNAVTIKALCCKVLGVLFSVAGGLPCGKEGPMIHSGSILGAGIPVGKSSVLGMDASFKLFQVFRSEKEKRDFIACGAAAGVAAAFGAPVGGVLFALEEGATHWHQGLTWKSFFCSMTSCFVLNFLLVAPGFGTEGVQFGYLGGQSGTFGFGNFSFEHSKYLAYYMLVFAAIGAGGGLAGALFNAANTRLTIWRFNVAPPRLRWRTKSLVFKLCEAITVALVVSAVGYWLSVGAGTCYPKPTLQGLHFASVDFNNTSTATPMQCRAYKLTTACPADPKREKVEGCDDKAHVFPPEEAGCDALLQQTFDTLAHSASKRAAAMGGSEAVWGAGVGGLGGVVGMESRSLGFGRLIDYGLLGTAGGAGEGGAVAGVGERGAYWMRHLASGNASTSGPSKLERCVCGSLMREVEVLITETPVELDKLVQLHCPDGSYNDLASLYLVSSEVAIKQLFHMRAYLANVAVRGAQLGWRFSWAKGSDVWCPDGGTGSSADCPAQEAESAQKQTRDFSAPSLLLFWIGYSLLACWTYGLSVPSGLFVPSLLAGAGYGSLCYQLLSYIGAEGVESMHPGLFTLVGAASGLGGMARMTISLAVIMIELTGVVNWGPPIMMALLAARWTGNTFNEGLYDIHVHLKRMPFLEYKPPRQVHGLQVRDLMTKSPVCLPEVVQAGPVYDMLVESQHNGFAVVGDARRASIHLDAALQAAATGDVEGTAGAKSPLPATPLSATELLSSGIPGSFLLFKGLIRRQHLTTLLHRGDFCTRRPLPYKRKPMRAAQSRRNSAGFFMGVGGGPGDTECEADFLPPQSPRANRKLFKSPSSGKWRESHKDRVSNPHHRSHVRPGDGNAGAARGSAIEGMEGSYRTHNADKHSLSFVDMEYDFPRYPHISEIGHVGEDGKWTKGLSAKQRTMWLDLTPYMNQSPPVVYQHAPGMRAYHYFRSMGLRHLTVINERNQVVGMVTRHDLTHHTIVGRALAKKAHYKHKQLKQKLPPSTLPPRTPSGGAGASGTGTGGSATGRVSASKLWSSDSPAADNSSSSLRTPLPRPTLSARQQGDASVMPLNRQNSSGVGWMLEGILKSPDPNTPLPRRLVSAEGRGQGHSRGGSVDGSGSVPSYKPRSGGGATGAIGKGT